MVGESLLVAVGQGIVTHGVISLIKAVLQIEREEVALLRSIDRTLAKLASADYDAAMIKLVEIGRGRLNNVDAKSEATRARDLLERADSQLSDPLRKSYARLSVAICWTVSGYNDIALDWILMARPPAVVALKDAVHEANFSSRAPHRNSGWVAKRALNATSIAEIVEYIELVDKLAANAGHQNDKRCSRRSLRYPKVGIIRKGSDTATHVIERCDVCRGERQLVGWCHCCGGELYRSGFSLTESHPGFDTLAEVK